MKRTWKVIGVMLMTLILTLGMSLGAFAQDSYTAINGDNTSVTLNKSLDLKGAEYGPTHTVTFTTAYVGNQLTGATQNAAGVPPVVTMSFDTSGADQAAKLDFTGVSFPAPGIYRFEVSETNISNSAVTPVSGTETSYYIDVYVTNVTTDSGNSELQIEQYILQDGSKTPTVVPDDVDSAKVTSADFKNEYTSYKLDVAKQVTGNQGDKSKEFTVTVTFSEGAGGDMFAVKRVEGTPKVDGTEISDGNPVDVTYTADGAASVELTLKDTDQVEFYGISPNVKYTVVETESGQDGYTTTGEVTTAKTLTSDASETVVNDKSGTIPTGLFINYGPYMAAAMAAVIAAIVFIRRRKSDEFEEDL